MKKPLKRRAANRRLIGESLEPRCLLAGLIQHGPTAEEFNNVAYFLRSDTPRIERYDIANEAWLSPITLAGATGTPTAELIDADGLYVSYGPAVYRYALDGSGQTHLLNSTDNVIAIHSDGNLLFLNHSSGLYARFLSIDKTTNTLIDSRDQYVESVYGSSISPQTNRILGRSGGISPSDITYVSYDDTGKFTGGGDSPYHGDYPGASKTWVFPGGTKVVDDSGTLYSTDSLTWLKAFGTSITDIGFSGTDIPIVLSGKTLTAYTSTILPTGSVTLTYSPADIFVNATDVITFTADVTSSTKFRADVVHLSDLKAPTPGQPVNPVGLAYTPDKIELAADGTLLLLSKANQSVFRWNPATQSYGATIPLVGTPDFMAYSAATNTIYTAYHSGLIRKIDLGAATPMEVPFTSLPDVPIGLATAGQYLFAVDPSGAWDSHYTFAPDGTKVDSVEWNYYSSEYVWNDANQKMYFFRDDTSPNDLLWEEINANGTAYSGEPAGGIRGELDSPLHDSAGFIHPIRVAPDGSVVVLGSGVIHDAKTLARSTMALSNSITDAAWLGGELYTMRSVTGVTEFQHWSKPTYGLDKTVQVPGTPKALLAVSATQMVGITLNASGVPNFTLLDANLSANTGPRQLSLSLTANTIAENQAAGTTIGTLVTTDNTLGHTYTYSLVAGAGDTDNGAFTIASASLKTGQSFNYEAKSSYSIRVRSTDEGGISTEQSFTINVTNVNEPPVGTGESYSTPEDTLLSIAAPGVLANDSDPEGASLKAILASQAAHGTVTLNISGSFTYLPVHDYAGPDSFTYRPSDNSLSGSVVTVSLTVTPVNDPPVAKDDSYSVAKDTEKAVAAAVGVLSNDTDVDSSTISAVIETGPDHGQLTLNADGSFRYLPTTGFIGVDKFTYRASDTQLSSGPATVTLTISDVNHPPVASNDQTGTLEDKPLLIPISSILANDSDVDGDALSVLLLVGSAPAHGTLTIQTGGSALLYTPDADFNGSDAFTYYASDGHATSNAATVVMTVAPVNDGPSFMKGPDLHLTDESGPQSYPLWATSVSAGPPNEAGQSLHFLITTDQAGLFAAGPSVSPAGELTFTPAANTSGTATALIALIDDGGTASGGVDFSQPQIFQISIDKPHPLHNAGNPVDSNNDGFIAANDVVLVINYINAQQVPAAGGSGEATGPIDDHDYVDVNGDNYVSAIDALSIINYLNAHPQAAGEAAAPVASGGASAAAANDLLALLAADTATQASGKRRNS